MQRVPFRFGFKVCGCLFALLTSLPAAPTELGRPIIENHSPRDYEGHNQVFNGVQGADGLMYFVNGDQVLRFDGERWDRAKVDTPFVRGILRAPDGTIYVSAIDEFGRLENLPDGSFRFASLVDRLPTALQPPGPAWIMVPHQDAIYFSVPGHVIKWQDESFAVIDTPYAERHLLIPIGDDLFEHVPGQGIYVLNGNVFEPVPAPPELVNTTTFLVVDRPDALPLVGVDDGQFRSWNPRTGETEIWHHQAEDLLNREGLFGGRSLRSGNLFLTTRSATVILLSPDGEIQRVVGADAGLDPAQVYGMREDEHGGIWLGSSKGVYRMELESPITMFDRLNGRTRGEFFDTFRLHDRLYTFTVEGLYRLEPGDLRAGRNARWARLDTEPNMFWAATTTPEAVFISTDYGLRVFDGETLQPIGGLNEPVVTCSVDPESPDRLFVGLHTGLRQLVREGGRWQDGGAIGPGGYEARYIHIGADGVMWVGAPGRGFYRLERPAPDRPWTDATATVYFRDHGLPANQTISEIIPSPTGPLFLTDQGVFRYQPDEDAFALATDFVVEGRSDFRISPAIFDDDGRLWAQVTFPGKFDDLRLGFFDTDDRGQLQWHPLPRRLLQLAGPRGVYGLGHERIDGREILWASGQSNLLRIELNDLAAEPTAPPVKVASLTAAGERHRLTPDANYAPTVPFNRGTLRVRFAAPLAGNDRTVEYQWRILGYNDAWSDWAPEAEATFTNLWGGPFTFEVRARSLAESVGPSSRIVFHISPPWYASTTAFFGYTLAGLIIVWLLVRWRVGRLDRERRRLEKLVAARTAELAVAKDDAESANRAKSAFLANMSHELRTPLNGVLGYAQIMLRDRNLPDTNREQARIVASSGEHLLKMINEVLDFSKIEAGKTELRPAPFNLADLLRDIEAAIAPRAAAKQLAFRILHDAGLPRQCLGDAQKLRQVIDNLLSNAIKFTAAGSVTLEIHRIEDSTTPRLGFAVIDTGVGLSAEDQTQLFTPFHQAVDGRPPEPGTGLGLSICRRLVQLMGGEITVQSSPGQGSRFAFDIPLEEISLADSANATAPDAAIVGYSGPRRRVLVVDDVEVNRHLLRDLLQPLGFTVTCVAGANAALAELTNRPADAVVLDLRMPDMDGLELTRRIRADVAAQPCVILTSASVLSFDPQTAFDAGCDDFLPKPFREADLLQRLGRGLRLNWNYASTRPDSNPPFDPSQPSPHLGELQAAAARGDIKRVRQALAAIREAGALPADRLFELEQAAAGYQMDLLRSKLNTISPVSDKS